MISQADYDELKNDAPGLSSQDVSDIDGELNQEGDPGTDPGQNFGNNIGLTIAVWAQRIRDMDTTQRDQFNEDVQQLVISENPGGDPGD